MSESEPQAAHQGAASTAAATAAPVVLSAARWFWWIAGLSLINTVLMHTGSNINFVLGLGVTAVSDAVFAGNPLVGYAIDAVALGFFYLMGVQARHGRLWAFYLGGTVYALDALVYVRFQDWMPVAFHAFVIYFIARGVMFLRRAPQAT